MSADLDAMAAMLAIDTLRERRAALAWVTSRFAADERNARALEIVFEWLVYQYEIGQCERAEAIA